MPRKSWVIVAIAAVSFIGVGLYFNNPEDLAPQLPPPPADALYKQSSQPIEARVADLLSRMTLEEKIGQMSLVDKNSIDKIDDISKYNLGGVLSSAGAKPKPNTPQSWLDMISEMKSQALQSRLEIPILYGVDANHGHANVTGATVFPHAIGLGASQNSQLVTEVARATSEELKATGINWSYSPSLDTPKDIRWGRVYEAFSDDPELVGNLGSAFISGTQTVSSDDNGESYVLASAKHYLGTGSMLWGESNHKKFKIDQSKITVNDQALNDEYLLPYRVAVQAGVSSIMVALNQWGDQRIIDSKYLITNKLKDELGFSGFVVSDWYGVYEYSNTNKYQANINTINAGLDMAMLPYDYKSFLRDVRRAIKDDKISQSRIDDAVSRILRQKFKAGLFEASANHYSLDSVGSDNHRKLARKAVSSSSVLLKNKDSLLPLKNTDDQILVAGSGADNVGRQSGAWTIEWQGVDGNWMPSSTSILAGIRAGAGENTKVDYDLNGNFPNLDSKSAIGIVVISEKPYAEGFGDNENPIIGKTDLEAIENLKKSADKVIIIILSGRPLIITDHIQSWEACIAAWLPGSEGGGIADVIFGNQPFTAKLPLPWPASIYQVPINSNGTTFNNTKPLFERGFGL